MRVGFYHVERGGTSRGTARALVDRMVQSVRAAMPGVEIAEMTGPVDRPMALGVLEAYASVSGDWLFLDTDVIVQEDVRCVFDTDFDLAVADRTGTFRPGEPETKFMRRMPVNKGVMFSRSQAFWRDTAEACCAYRPERQEWMGDQQAVNDVILRGAYLVQVLPNRYNYPPHARHEDVRDKAILHFKGGRKGWMLDRRAA